MTLSSPGKNSSITFEEISSDIDLEIGEEIIVYSHQLSQQSELITPLIPLPILKNINILQNSIKSKNTNFAFGTVSLSLDCFKK